MSYSAIGLALAAALNLVAVAAPAAPTESARSKAITVTVEIIGSLPGYTQEQLSAYVSAQMAAADVAAWTFKPGPYPATAGEPPNRIVWHFKPLPFAGGAVRYIGPGSAGGHQGFDVGRAVGIDAKIYLDGQYQASAFDQATIQGGHNDPDLAHAILKLTRVIVADALADILPGGTRQVSRAGVKIG